jgi:hypothetical protein
MISVWPAWRRINARRSIRRMRSASRLAAPSWYST